MKTISEILQFSTDYLNRCETPRLDAEVLLCHALNLSRAALYAKINDVVDETIFQALLERRKQGEPIAYITGSKEFWSLSLIVNPDVLIPRPETELLVERALALYPREAHVTVADLGTGSGAVALAIASECPAWNIIAVDKSNAALNVAKENAKRLNINNVKFIESNWLEKLNNVEFDLIVSNPPYILENDKHLEEGDVRFEPKAALVSKNQGLSDIESIIKRSKKQLKVNGFLLLEHGCSQAKQVRDFFEQYGYADVSTQLDLAKLPRVTVGCNKC